VGSERRRQIPGETVIIDASGRFAIPGLFDMHVHNNLEGTSQQAYLAYGVTSARDTGAWLAWLNTLADRGEASNDPVPRYFFSGAPFLPASWSLPALQDHVQIEDEEDARTYVRLWKESGAHFIKAYPPMPWTMHRALADEALQVGLPVVGHGTSLEEVTKSVTLGYRSLEHIASPRPYGDVIQMLTLAGSRWDPNLTVSSGQYLLLRDEPERLNDSKLRTFANAWCVSRAERTAERDEITGVRTGWVDRLEGVRAAHSRGVKLLVGTDSEPDTWSCFYGLAVHWELEFLVQAGIQPLEALRIATQEAAAAIGADRDLGTLQVGKLADIVLLDANPLEDIKNTQAIWRVIKGGFVFDPNELRPERN
jgi:imidazolonepropionase-like amidohydrolase